MRVAAVVVALVLSLSACSEVEETSGGCYEPARLEAVAGSEVKRVTFTEEGARRTGLRGTVANGGDRGSCRTRR